MRRPLIRRWLDDSRRDLRHAIRTLVRTPAFTVTAILSIALGIGANTAIFSLVDQVLLRALPVRDPARLVLIDWRGNQLAAGFGSGNLMSYPMCRDIQSQTAFFDGVFCRHPTTVNLSVSGEPRPAPAEIISGTYFPVLGVRPHLGRLIAESDDVQPDAHPVVVLAFDYWSNTLGSPPDIVGRKVLVNSHPMTVIGVAERGFRGMDVGEAAVIWMPAMMKKQATPDWDRLLDRRARWMHVFGRLKPGVTVESTKAGLQPWFKSVLETDRQLEGFPTTTPDQLRAFLGSYLDVTPAARGRSNLRTAMETPLWVLLAGTSLLVLLACANVAGLLLARGAARGREIVTRIALGATRGRIANQLLIESLVISIGGGALGLVAAPALAAGLLSFLPQDVAPVSVAADVDARMLFFTFLVSVATGVLCGLGPALKAGRIPIATALRERAPSGGGVRMRRALVVGQIAFTLLLLICAGLFLQTLARLYQKGPGFESGGLLMFRIDTASGGYDDAKGSRLILQLLDSVRNTPGVAGAAIGGHALLAGGSWNTHMTIDETRRRSTERVVHCTPVTPGFFSTLGVRLVAGRDFDQRPGPSDGDRRYRTAIVNASFARRYFAGGSPIGHRIGFGVRPDTKTDVEIIGVVADFSYRDLREETEQAFFPFLDLPWPAGVFYVRTQGSPEQAFAGIRATVKGIDGTLPVASLRTVDTQIARSLRTERMMATLLAAFGAMALLLSIVGLYGVMSFVVTQRTREIGVRLALGATRGMAVWLVVRDALIMIGSGTAIALLASLGLGRILSAQLFGIEAVDAPTMAGATVMLAIVALASAAVPAWRASSVSPTEALHAE